MNKLELLLNSGFNLYEAKILSALNEVPSSTAKDISQISEVPKNKVYEILEDLLRTEIIEVLPTKPKKYNSPNLKELIKNRLSSEAEKLKELEKQTDILLAETNEQEKIDSFWVTEGQHAMVGKIVKTMKKVKKESIGYIDIWTVRDENLKAIKNGMKRGVKFYFLGNIDTKTRSIAKKYFDLGVEVKNYPVKEAGYSIFDSRYVQMRVTKAKTISIWIDNKYLAGIMREHFFENWKKGRTVKF